MAGEIMDLYLKRRQRCLLVCPAQLRDTTWKRFRSAHFLGDVECLSYEELAIDRQIAMTEPEQFQDKLERHLKEYQLVVVDEDCTPSGLVRQIGAIQEGRISGSS
jgi:hypothetical protein